MLLLLLVRLARRRALLLVVRAFDQRPEAEGARFLRRGPGGARAVRVAGSCSVLLLLDDVVLVPLRLRGFAAVLPLENRRAAALRVLLGIIC